jgi:hypothetical protein
MIREARIHFAAVIEESIERITAVPHPGTDEGEPAG